MAFGLTLKQEKIINEIFSKYPQIKKLLFTEAVQKEISEKALT